MTDISDEKTALPMFNTAFSYKFTKQCLGRFYQDTTLSGATEMKERNKRHLLRQKIDIAKQQERVDLEMRRIEEAQRIIQRKKEREIRRILDRRTRASQKIQIWWRDYSFLRRHTAISHLFDIVAKLQRRKSIENKWNIWRENTRKIVSYKVKLDSICISFKSQIMSTLICKCISRKLEQQEQLKSSLTIQICIRKALARRKLKFLKHEKMLERRKLESCIDIQRVFRGFVARRTISHLCKVVLHIQACFRGYFVRRRRLSDAKMIALSNLPTDSKSSLQKLPKIINSGPTKSSTGEIGCVRCMRTHAKLNSDSDNIETQPRKLPSITHISLPSKSYSNIRNSHVGDTVTFKDWSKKTKSLVSPKVELKKIGISKKMEGRKILRKIPAKLEAVETDKNRIFCFKLHQEVSKLRVRRQLLLKRHQQKEEERISDENSQMLKEDRNSRLVRKIELRKLKEIRLQNLNKRLCILVDPTQNIVNHNKKYVQISEKTKKSTNFTQKSWKRMAKKNRKDKMLYETKRQCIDNKEDSRIEVENTNTCYENIYAEDFLPDIKEETLTELICPITSLRKII